MTAIATNAESNCKARKLALPEYFTAPTSELAPFLLLHEFLMFKSVGLGEVTPT